MNICFICKYPPIQGGVAASTFWHVRELSRKGHSIHVVSNAWEVEEIYRQYLVGEDLDHLRDIEYSNGGSVTHHFTNPFITSKFIPQNQPFTSKLAAKSIEVIKKHSCDIIYAYYLEPYGVAAFLASIICNVPFYIRHAGSDITRLMQNRELELLYREILNRAAGVMTSGRGRSIIQSIVNEQAKIHVMNSDFLPMPEFSNTGPILDINAFLNELDAHVVENKLFGWPTMPLSRDKINIGIYCKASPSKGIEQLISALAKMKDLYNSFNLLLVIGGNNLRQYQMMAASYGQEFINIVRFLPFLPPWKVPAFLRSCDVVCNLENNFSVPIHGPRLAREILACGRCLVVSDEILQKQFFKNRVATFENAVVVNSLDNNHELSTKLRRLITNKALIEKIGKEGFDLYSSLNLHDPDLFIQDFEAALNNAKI